MTIHEEAKYVLSLINEKNNGIINAGSSEVVREVCAITGGYYYDLNGRIQTEYLNHIIYAIIK